MINKSDILIDVSFNLTDWWLKYRINGGGFYSEFPELYCESYPATIKDVLEACCRLNNENAAYLLESISCGLYLMLKEDGVI